MTVPSERDRLEAVYRELLSDESKERWSESNPGNLAILAERVRWTHELLSRAPTKTDGMILDLGSGGNTTLTPQLDAGTVARIGVDLLFERLQQASMGVALGLVCADGVALPFPDETFDVVALFTVFSSVGDRGTCARIATEVTRVLKHGGSVVWYDVRYRNPANPNLRPQRRRTVEALFPRLRADWRSITVLPPVARRLGRFTRIIYPALAALPPLRSHLLGVLTKPAAPSPAD